MNLAEAFYKAAANNLKHPLTRRIAVLLDKQQAKPKRAPIKGKQQ